LPKKAVVHHVNEIKIDNKPQNLVACENQSYHCLLHKRKRAIGACGHANWLLCQYCKQYDDPKNLYIGTKGRNWHKECKNKFARNLRKKNKIKEMI